MQSASFDDKGFGPPPAKWKGKCAKPSQNFTGCNKYFSFFFCLSYKSVILFALKSWGTRKYMCSFVFRIYTITVVKTHV